MTTYDKIERVAKAEVGYHEGKTSGQWDNDQKYSDELPGFKWSDGQPWCATFVCWSFWKVGAYDLLPSPSASCDNLAAGFKKNGRWSEYPAKGAVVFYGVPSDLNHTGIVVGFNEDFIWTVEGNTNDDGSREGDGVYLKKRARKGANVIGYGYPKFKEGIESADPKYADDFRPQAMPQAKAEVSLRAAVRAASIAGWAKRIGNVTVRQDAALVKQALKAEGVANYKDWQKECGVKANGRPDLKSLKALGKKHGFRVVS